MSEVGFVGVGNMGWPMAANLVKAGFTVNVNDSRRETANNFVQSIGGFAPDSLRQLGEKTVEALDEEEREIREEPYRRVYGEEFATHGIDRLEILDQRYLGGAKNKRELS